MRQRHLVLMVMLTLAACTSPLPSPTDERSPIPSPTASPMVTCGELAPVDCQAAATAALAALAGANGTVIRVDLAAALFCPIAGPPIGFTTCPPGGPPPPDGGEWIGSALVTFSGSLGPVYLNIWRNGQVVKAAFVALAIASPSS